MEKASVCDAGLIPVKREKKGRKGEEEGEKIG